ncbi:MAG TPA: sigma-70 family RNA polymerase sigma factor [Puia sp.]
MRSLVAQERSDTQLLTQLRESNREALEVLYFRYGNFLFHYALRRLDCHATASDLIQELFLKLWIKRQSLSPKGELQPFLTTCLRNLIIDHYSHEQVKKKHRAATSPEESDHQTADLIDYHDTHRLLQSGINSLPRKMRQIFHLNKIDDYSIDEIANELNLSRQTVKNQLSTAIKRLRMSLNTFGSLTIFLTLFQN